MFYWRMQQFSDLVAEETDGNKQKILSSRLFVYFELKIAKRHES